MLSVEHLPMPIATESSIDLLRITKARSGKVRKILDPGDTLRFVASDRISAFDVILPCAKR